MEEKGFTAQIYDCGNGNSQLSYENVTADDREMFIEALSADGYTQSGSNTIGTNQFNTFSKGEHRIYVNYYPKTARMNIIDVSSTPATAGSGLRTDASVTPTLAQLGRKGADASNPNGAPGMSYVFQISDGRFIIVDGGPSNSDDEKALLDYLNRKKPAAHEKPIIAGWFFTHAHSDHMELAYSFVDKYHADIELLATYANFPNFDKLTLENEDIKYMKQYANLWNAVTHKYFPNASVYKFHTGEKFVIGDAEIDILFTHEEYFPTTFYWGNDTSSAFRVGLGGNSIIFLGDCDTRATPVIAELYGEELDCDILQLAHHGFNGGDAALYSYCAPDICLWAVDEERFNTDKRCLGTASGYEFNKTLRNDANITHYHSSVDTIITLNK